MFRVGECRHSSAGNVYVLDRIYDPNHVGVRRVANGAGAGGASLWDAGVVYRWTSWQWESLPLVGQKSDDPTFGMFIGRKSGYAIGEPRSR